MRLAAGIALALIAATPAAAAGPQPLSRQEAPARIDSQHGSGVFGRWGVDARGLPRYRYTIDEAVAPQAAQPEMNGRRDAWHQLGNDHVVATAFNRGYTQLWTMDHQYQFANYADATRGHYGGGYGYLAVGDKVGTTLYEDRADGQPFTRDFGAGYSRFRTTIEGVDVSSRVYAPFGDDPLLLHDVVLRNTGTETVEAAWFEYWDVNPYVPATKSRPGLDAPVHDPGSQILTVAQRASARDTAPLTTFAAPIKGVVDSFETDASKFFGAGGREAPEGATAEKLTDSIAPPATDGGVHSTGFVMRSPVTLKPGQKVTLRYAYGYTHADRIQALVHHYRNARRPYARSARSWRRWLPQADLGRRNRWLARELQWSAYTLRSATTYEDCARRHIISQGGYYQYDLGFQGAFRDPLQHVMPLIYANPYLVRETLAYSAAEQPAAGGVIPYARISGCVRFDLGTSNDLDLWLLLTAAEYGLATRDLGFFDEVIPWADTGSAPLWDHLKAAVDHQELQRGPNRGYIAGSFGDWSDISTPLIQMTESTLVTAQAAYIYPRLAELADLRGDADFAAKLRALGDDTAEVLRGEWSDRGWYARGYSGARPFGVGSIYGEPQPWAILAGVPDAGQSKTLVDNIRRYLTGIGAPGGPARIGSSQSPSAEDPGATEKDVAGNAGVGDNHAVYVGGSWFAINGWLTWALGRLDGIVPKAKAYAFDELKRNALATRATVYPDHWNGILSVDDACRSWYSTDPHRCGVGLSTGYTTQIMHQPAWELFDIVKLAGVEPDARGYVIDPHLPMKRFSLRLPHVGVAASRRGLRGYVRPQASGVLRMRVKANAERVFADGRRVRFTRSDGFVEFDLPAGAGRAADWAVVGR